MPSRASAARASSGTIISPFAHDLNENRPGRYPRARRFAASSGNRMMTICFLTRYKGLRTHCIGSILARSMIEQKRRAVDQRPGEVLSADEPGVERRGGVGHRLL